MSGFKEYIVYALILRDEKIAKVDISTVNYFRQKIKKIINEPHSDFDISGIIKQRGISFEEFKLYELDRIMCNKGTAYDTLFAYIKWFKDNGYTVASSEGNHKKSSNLNDKQENIYNNIIFSIDDLNDDSKEYERYQHWKTGNTVNNSGIKKVTVKLTQDELNKIKRNAEKMNLSHIQYMKQMALQEGKFYSVDVSKDEELVRETRELIEATKKLILSQVDNKEIHRADILEISKNTNEIRENINKLLLDSYDKEDLAEKILQIIK